MTKFLAMNKKPKCPMCGGEITLSEMIFNGAGEGSGTFLAGNEKDLRYRCTFMFGVCNVSVDVYNHKMEIIDRFERRVGKAKHWRDALKRYESYVEFINDNQKLKLRLLLLADDNMNIEGDTNFLFC